MICCDGCEDWFHGKCVNITKAMGQQMEERGIEWRCPNCIKKAKPTPKSATKVSNIGIKIAHFCLLTYKYLQIKYTLGLY